MSSYYDQPSLRQRGPEDVAGVLVLITCAVLAFAWYVAVSRLHLRDQQYLEMFLYIAILFFGGGGTVCRLIASTIHVDCLGGTMRNVVMIRREAGLVAIPAESAVYCGNCETVSTSAGRRC